MISTEDFISLPYTPDLTEGGIAYACRCLPHVYDRGGSPPFDRMRHVVSCAAVELAFRRYLTQHNIPFRVKGATPFTDPDRYDVSLAGHRCDIKSFLISYRSQITVLRADPGLALKAPALVPLEQDAADGHISGDLYLFAFLTGLIARSPNDTQKVLASGQPIYLIHRMANQWMRPQNWLPLGPLTLKSESKIMIRLEIGGQDAARQFLTRSVELSPRTPTRLDADFHSLAYLHAESQPSARLGLFSPTRHESYLINPAEWGNIWVYGMEILFAGWISYEEFHRRARVINEGRRVFQFNQTRTRNLALSVSELRPLAELFERVRAEAIPK